MRLKEASGMGLGASGAAGWEWTGESSAGNGFIHSRPQDRGL